MDTSQEAKAPPQKVIYSKERVQLSTQFGPYPGKDAIERKFSEWMAFVRKAKIRSEANLIAFARDGQKYFRSCKVIEPYETFTVWDESCDANPKGEQMVSSTFSNGIFKQVANGESQIITELLQEKRTPSKDRDTVHGKPQFTMTLRKKKQPKHKMKSRIIANSSPANSSKSFTNYSELNISNASSLSSTSEWNPENSFYSCPDCGESYVSMAGLALHRLLHLQDKKCVTCGDNHTRYGSLHQHLQLHLGEICDQCDRYFDKEFDLQPSIPRILKTPLCHECQSSFIVNEDIIIAKSLTGETTCNYCGKEYLYKKSLMAHLNKHNSKYCCRICSSSFGTYNSMVRHITVHTDFKAYECIKCGRSFKRLLPLQQHEKICKKKKANGNRSLDNTNGKKEANGSLKITIPSPLRKNLHNFVSSITQKDSSDENNSVSLLLVPMSSNYLLMNPIKTEPEDPIEDIEEVVSPSIDIEEGLGARLLYVANNETSYNQLNTSYDSQDGLSADDEDIEDSVQADDEDIEDTAFIDEVDETFEPDFNEFPRIQIKRSLSMLDCRVEVDSLFSCPDCDKFLATPDGLAMHKLLHFVGVKCSKCGVQFSLDAKLKEHLAKHPVEGIKNCFKCQVLFCAFSGVQNMVTIESYLCNECDKVARCASNSSEFKCYCGIFFKNVEELNEHAENHLKGVGTQLLRSKECTTTVASSSKTTELVKRKRTRSECSTIVASSDKTTELKKRNRTRSECTTTVASSDKTTELMKRNRTRSECTTTVASSGKTTELMKRNRTRSECTTTVASSGKTTELMKRNRTRSECTRTVASSGKTTELTKRSECTTTVASSDITTELMKRMRTRSVSKLLEEYAFHSDRHGECNNEENSSKQLTVNVKGCIEGVPKGRPKKSIVEEVNACFSYECDECRRSFQTEAGTALHTLLHFQSFCNACGNLFEEDFDYMEDKVSTVGSLLCESCKRIANVRTE